MTKPIVWIASYPKSGNTWVRFMLCNLLYGRQESAAALNELAPDVHESERPAEPRAGLLKTHFAFSAELPHRDRTTAAIYVVRHPADVLASNFFYWQRSAGSGGVSPMAFDDYVESFLAHRGDPRWLELGMGSWQDNVVSWLKSPLPFPVLQVRYEDLVHDPLSGCRAIAQFLQHGSSEEHLEQTVRNSSFQRMREVERADIRDKRVGIFYKPYLQASIDAGSRFMRRGIVGDGAARLSTAQSDLLRATFAPLLRDLGYAAV